MTFLLTTKSLKDFQCTSLSPYYNCKYVEFGKKIILSPVRKAVVCRFMADFIVAKCSYPQLMSFVFSKCHHLMQ